jgi:hypothetical protein
LGLSFGGDFLRSTGDAEARAARPNTAVVGNFILNFPLSGVEKDCFWSVVVSGGEEEVQKERFGRDLWPPRRPCRK